MTFAKSSKKKSKDSEETEEEKDDEDNTLQRIIFGGDDDDKNEDIQVDTWTHINQHLAKKQESKSKKETTHQTNQAKSRFLLK